MATRWKIRRFDLRDWALAAVAWFVSWQMGHDRAAPWWMAGVATFCAGVLGGAALFEERGVR